MASSNNDLLIFPILDLIKDSFNQINTASSAGTGGYTVPTPAPPVGINSYADDYPSVILNRDNLLNPNQVTSAILTYGDYSEIISLNRDATTGMLQSVDIIATDNSGNQMYEVLMTMVYDPNTGLLDAVDTNFVSSQVAQNIVPVQTPVDAISFN